MKAGKTWFIVLLGLMVIFSAYWVGTQWRGDSSSDAQTADTPPQEDGHFDPPPIAPYELEVLPGLQRGDPDRHFVVISSSGKRLPITRLHDMVSHAGEDKVAFLQRVRSEMTTYSDNHSHEVCGTICSDGSQYSVALTTVSASAFCVVTPTCVQGHESMAQSIHSHCPGDRPNKATLADEWLSDGKLQRRKVIGRCRTDQFSSMDFAGTRPSWLAGRKALHRQNGPRDVQSFD